jgi:GNAT superfamily N-acetyltransferase
MKALTLADISIRTDLHPGDIGMITYLHGSLYHAEFGFGISFESYVAGAFAEFYSQYDPDRDRVWICEHEGKIIGSLLLMRRESGLSQLRFFIIRPEYRKIGLGRHLISRCIAFAKEKSYEKIYLWTTNNLPASQYLYNSFGFDLIEEKYSEGFGVPLMEQYYELKL